MTKCQPDLLYLSAKKAGQDKNVAQEYEQERSGGEVRDNIVLKTFNTKENLSSSKKDHRSFE